MFGIFRIYDICGDVIGIDAGGIDAVWDRWRTRGVARVVLIGRTRR